MPALAAAALILGLSTAQAQPKADERPNLSRKEPIPPQIRLWRPLPGVGILPCGSLDLSCDLSQNAQPFTQLHAGDAVPVPALTIRFGGEKAKGKPSILVRSGGILQTALFITALIVTFAL